MIDLAPGLALLPASWNTLEARVMLRTIQLQEDPKELRRQMGNGPARGAWQFEKGGGVAGVLKHPSVAVYAAQVCAARGVRPLADDVWSRLETDDALACAFARLLLRTDPFPLPAIGDVDAAWKLYLRTWRPGAYTNGDEAARVKLRTKFGKNHQTAVREFTA